MRPAGVSVLLLVSAGMSAQVNRTSAAAMLTEPTAAKRVDASPTMTANNVHPIPLCLSYEHYVHEIPLSVSVDQQDRYLKPASPATREHGGSGRSAVTRSHDIK
jgi:hypothetical protein